jgi:voltage-gated potassium channel
VADRATATATDTNRRRIYLPLAVFVLVFCLGVAGFKILGGGEWSVSDSVYQTVITLSTVGYNEAHPFTNRPGLRAFAIIFNLVCLGTIAFAITSITAFVVEGELRNILWRRRMDKQIARLKDHYIVCGGDETAQTIVRELQLTKRPLVVVVPSADRAAGLGDPGEVLFFEGDATDDAVLLQAGIERARGIFLSLPTDEENLFVTISARNINPGLRVVVKSVEHTIEQKFVKAGADTVISPTFIGGMRMVSEMVRPAATTFLDMMLRDRDRVFRVDEVAVAKGAELVGKTVEQARLAEKTGALLVALRRAGAGGYEFNPPKDRVIEENDILIIIAEAERLKDIGRIAGQD